MRTELSFVHVVAGLQPRHGGPSRTVVNLTDSLSRLADSKVILLSQGLVGEPAVASAAAEIHRFNVETSSSYALALGLPLRRQLTHFVLDRLPSLIHSHGLWTPANHWAAKAARQSNIPLIIQPRGMLEPWALSQRAWKKRLAMTLYQRRDLDQAAMFIATAWTEGENIRRLGFRQPIAVIPNGVELDVPGVDGCSLHQGLERPRTVLFLSRIHPKKGLLNLLDAWARVVPNGWRLKIAGPDEGGHLVEVRALARRLGIDPLVDFVGELDGVAKSQAYAGADLFVLPTFSENFGVVVAEALAHGVPVITTRGTPWADLETYRCGWWVDIGVDPLMQALREAMDLSDDERRAMGVRGRAYVRRYDWGDIARQTMDVYRWVLGKGTQPACVRTD